MYTLQNCMYVYIQGVQGVSGLLALPLQLVLGQRDDPHRMEKECTCTHTKIRVRVCAGWTSFEEYP